MEVKAMNEEKYVQMIENTSQELEDITGILSMITLHSDELHPGEILPCLHATIDRMNRIVHDLRKAIEESDT